MRAIASDRKYDKNRIINYNLQYKSQEKFF
jgi:hypothetical protein